MRVVVLGGTGFIGPFAIKQILARGHEVTVFHRGSTHSERLPEVAHLYGDSADLGQFVSDFAKLGPDVVLAMRPYTEAEGSELLRVFRGVAK